MLEIGMKAPNFTLSDKNGDQVSLLDCSGKKSYCIFIPKTIHRAVPGRPVQLYRNITFLLYWFQILNFRRFRHTICGKKRNFTAK